MSDELKRHYQALFREHGDSARAAQHFDDRSQRRRFEVLVDGIREPGASVLDVGCGLGHLADFLSERGPTRYLGVDLVPEFVAQARQRLSGRPGIEFRELDFRTDPLPEGFDYALLCGVFNNRLEDNREFMLETLRRMFAAARTGIVFNALSTYVDFQDPQLYYSDPRELLHFCKVELSRKVVLRHEYLVKEGGIPYEYAMYVYR
jgi:SAM-dependent methyltransferase